MDKRELDNTKESEYLKILLTEYQLHKQEVNQHLQFYQAQLKQFQFVYGAVAVVVGFLLANPTVRPNLELWWLWWIGSFIIPLAVSYIVLAISQAIYHLVLLSGRLREIESKINSICGIRLLIWESIVIPKFFSSARPHPGILNPGPYWAGMITIIFVAVGLVPSVYIDIRLWDLSQAHHWAMRTVVILGLFIQLLAITVSLYVCFSVAAKMRERVSRWFMEYL